MKNFGKGIGGALLSLAFVFGIVAATSVTASAQYRNDDDYYRRGNSDRYRKEQKKEWKRRRKEARRDARLRRNGDWRNDGYYDPYGRNGGYSQVELDRGYQQGLETGASDGQRGQSHDPQRSRHFRNASTQAFREGFVRGYDQGYRQYAGYRNQGNGGWGNILGGILRP